MSALAAISARLARGPLAAYALAVVAVALVTVLKIRFEVVGRDAPMATYLGVVMVVAWFGGAGPGLVATALACLAGAWFFAPIGSIAIASDDDVAHLIVTTVEGSAISLLAGMLRHRNVTLQAEIAERARAEEALRAATAQLHHAEKMQAFGVFAAEIAHDLGNMVGVLTACVELLDRRLPGDHVAREEVATIRETTERVAALMRDLRAFARRRDVAPGVIDLHAALARIEPILKRVVGDGVRVALDLRAGHPRVRADVPQLEQAIVNLAANARDAMPAGGTLTIATGKTESARIALSVSDTGTGMDEATRSRVFEPFFTTKPVGKGTGLGMSIVFGVVEAMGGEVDVASEPGHGTTVRMLLPLAE